MGPSAMPKLLTPALVLPWRCVQPAADRADSSQVDLLSRARHALNVDNDALSAHRARVRRNFSILGAMAFLPLALLHVVSANWPMFAVNTVVGGAMLANAWALQRGRKPAPTRRCHGQRGSPPEWRNASRSVVTTR